VPISAVVVTGEVKYHARIAERHKHYGRQSR
jgi:hypothetical protein